MYGIFLLSTLDYVKKFFGKRCLDDNLFIEGKELLPNNFYPVQYLDAISSRALKVIFIVN